MSSPVTPAEDSELPNDPQRLSALYTEHEQRLRRFVVGILRDAAAADDIVQIAFAKAAESAGDVPPAAMKSWLYRVAMNEAISWRRRAGFDRAATAVLANRRSPAGERPEAGLVRKETIDAVRRALENLSPAERRVVLARVYEDRKFVEIAAETKSPLATVITQMRRALEKLRRQLNRRDP
jgi:RNA polymerase sigma factor (sigma-70 family)